MQMTEKSVNIAAVLFTETGSAVVEHTVAKIPIVPIAMKAIIVLTVESVLMIPMFCAMTVANA